MRSLRVCVIAIALALSLSAQAQDKEAARKAFVEGTKYYNLNQYADALESFKRAYWNFEDPSFLYNIAQCHRALKHKSEAVEFYKSYLRNAPDAPNRTDVQRIVTELEAAIAQERAVTTAPPQGTLAEPTKAPPPAVVATPAVSATPAPAPGAERPVWKRGWFWGVMAGAAVVVGVGVGLGVGLGTSSAKDPTATFGHVAVN